VIIVIDAYNVMHAVFKIYSKKVNERQRSRFIAQLGTYGKRKGNKIVLVFDGGPYEWPYKEHVQGVYVVYAGVHQTADDYIKEYLDEHRSKDLLLVSSDRELREYAARLDISVLRVTKFWDIMQDTMQTSDDNKKISVSGGNVVKITEAEHADLDRLMMQASEVVPLKSEDMAHDNTEFIQKHGVGKKDRKLLKKLKKL